MKDKKQYLYGLIVFILLVIAIIALSKPVQADNRNQTQEKQNEEVTEEIVNETEPTDHDYVCEEESMWLPNQEDSNGIKLITATAYYDAYGHGYGADGSKLVEGLTVAGRIEDLGKTALIYDMDRRLIGIYEFRDTGYGKSTGQGRSQILKGRTMGDIETGETVDIYFKTYAQCKAWGRRQVFIQIIDAKG